MTTAIELKLLQKQRLLFIKFDDGAEFELSCEYLRVFSPSAEVRGHAGEKPKVVNAKQQVNIVGIDRIGNYAVKLIFDDGHDSGIYSWEWLYRLGKDYAKNWQEYLQRLEAAGLKPNEE